MSSKLVEPSFQEQEAAWLTSHDRTLTEVVDYYMAKGTVLDEREIALRAMLLTDEGARDIIGMTNNKVFPDDENITEDYFKHHHGAGHLERAWRKALAETYAAMKYRGTPFLTRQTLAEGTKGSPQQIAAHVVALRDPDWKAIMGWNSWYANDGGALRDFYERVEWLEKNKGRSAAESARATIEPKIRETAELVKSIQDGTYDKSPDQVLLEAKRASSERPRLAGRQAAPSQEPAVEASPIDEPTLGEVISDYVKEKKNTHLSADEIAARALVRSSPEFRRILGIKQFEVSNKASMVSLLNKFADKRVNEGGGRPAIEARREMQEELARVSALVGKIEHDLVARAENPDPGGELRFG